MFSLLGQGAVGALKFTSVTHALVHD